MFKLFIAVICASSIVRAQLTAEVQQHLKNLANSELQKQLVNGSDNKNANTSEQTQKSLMSIVQAGQILSYLNVETSEKDKICKWVSDAEINLPQHSAETVFYKAESLRLFKCNEGKVKVIQDIKQILDQPTTVLTSINDYYNAFMINKRAKHYGVEVDNPGTTEFIKSLLSNLEKSWVDGFSLDTFQLKSEKSKSGATIESLKLLEMMSTLQKDKSIGDKIQKKVKGALTKLIKEASGVSDDPYSRYQNFFVVPKNAQNGDFDSTAFNLHLLNTIIDGKRGIPLADIGFSDVYFSLYKNYFESKATSAQSVKTAFYALRGLKSQADQVFLSSTGIVDNIINFDIVGLMGLPAKIKAVKKAEIVTITTQKVTDVSGLVKLNGESQIQVDINELDLSDLTQSSNVLTFEIDGSAGSKIHINKTFEFKMQLSSDIEVKVSQNNKKQVPMHFQFEKGYPRDFNALNTNDNPYLHVEIKAEFAGIELSQVRPASVYITLLRDDDMIPYTRHARYNSTTQRYIVQSDLRKQMKEQINGDYNFLVHVDDPRADQAVVKNLGSFQINFNEGSQEGTNLGVRDDYQLYETITNYFPPEPKDPSPVFPLAFTGLILFMFTLFFIQLFSNGANLGNLSFFGLIFLINFVAILLIIIFFWFGYIGPFKLNLVNTLWILFAATPVTLFTMNYGLTPENCYVSAFQKPAAGKGKKDQ